MADAQDDDSEGSRGKRNDDPAAGGNDDASPAESEAESSSSPEEQRAPAAASTSSGDAFLDAVKGVSDSISVEEDQYAPAPPSSSTPSLARTASASASAAAAASAAPKPPPAAPSLSRRGSLAVSSGAAAAYSEESAEKAAAALEAAAEAKRLADAERRKELVTQLEHLSETLKLYEREHDFFYTGLAGFGVLIGLVVFVSTWLAGLSGSLSLSTETRSRALQVVIASAGIVGGLFSTAQRVWSPAVRSQYYKNARDDYARLRKKCKAALGGNNDGGGEASLAALESAVRSISAKAGEEMRFCFAFLFFLFVALFRCERGQTSKETKREGDGFLVSHLEQQQQQTQNLEKF